MEPWFAALARPTAAVPSAAAHNNALAWRTSRAGIFTEIEANTLAKDQVNLVAVPRPSWKPFFERVVATRTQAENQRETSLGLVKDASWRGKRVLAQAA